MTVPLHVQDWVNRPLEEVNTLSTRALHHLLKLTRRSMITCGCAYHCGDEYLHFSDKIWNDQVRRLSRIIRKSILPNREPFVHTRNQKRSEQRRLSYREKKRMRY